jgi:3-dehydroquinate synthase
MERGRVVRPECRGDASLGIARVALVGLRLREDENVAAAQFSGGTQGGNAAPDDEEGADAAILPSAPMRHSASPAPVRLTVRAASSLYTVEIAAGLSRTLAATLDTAKLPPRRFIVSSPTVWRLHGERFRTASAEEPILIPDGERFKTLATAGRVYDGLVKAQADRGCALIAIGGGVIGDMAGFAAATFLRGIPVAQVPTTLLAQVDSAIGGKTGVNHPLGKNLIGAYHQPSVVIVDPELLATLPRREFRAGLYEVVKYGVIASRRLFERIDAELTPLFARESASLIPVIAESCGIKARVVAEDERESGPRRVLNFGHTAGHALEAITRYRRFRHGEAVAYGMLAAAEIAFARGVLPAADLDALRALIVKMGPLPPIADLETSQVLEAVARDKKIVEGTLHYVLPAAIGRTIIAADVTGGELGEALRRMGLR